MPCEAEHGAVDMCLPGEGFCQEAVDCVGAWATCDINCNKVYQVTTEASNGGAECEASSGDQLDCATGEGDCPCAWDSDECLRDSPSWGSTYTCAGVAAWCEQWGKDMSRCCPESCGTGPLTEAECNALTA